MKRKRQQDFQKTKLKVGRQLSRGNNVTNTSFKTKKIITHDQLKATAGEVSLKDLLKFLSSNNSKNKIESLHRISKYISEKESTLSLYFPDIIKKLGTVLLESDAKVRDVAIQVISSCLRLLSDVQLKSFFLPITSYLNCMMTHVATSVRRDSLKLVKELLISHPGVICHSTRILTNLLNMISSVRKTMKARKLDDYVSSIMTSRDWRNCVFECMQMLLQSMLKIQHKKESKNDDEKSVYWNGEKTLYLPLYINGGTRPVKLEESWEANENIIGNLQEFKIFVCDLVPVISEAVKGEIPYSENRNFEVVDVFNPAIIRYLNSITQVLCCLGEWFQTDSNFKNDMDRSLFDHLTNIVCHQLLKGFPYIQYVPANERGKKQAGSKCLPLNLGICYLYSVFVLDSESSKLNAEKAVLTYLVDMFRNCNKLCNESIDFILKISKILVECKCVNTYHKNAVLLGLYRILEVYKVSPIAMQFYSFFMDLSLDYEFKHLLKSEGMVTWFKLTYKELTFMKESGLIDNKFLKYVRQICARKYAPFMELINLMGPEKFIVLLKHDHEELQLTVVQLICSLDKLSSEFLQKLADVIHEESFSVKTVTRLIWQLHVRYSRPGTSVTDTVIFAKFLLNVGCDTRSVFRPPAELEPTSYSEVLDDIQGSSHFAVYHIPIKWERHRTIFEVCLECLMLYSNSKQVAQCINIFIKDLMLTQPKLPVHTVITLFHIRSKVGYIYNDKHLLSMYLELIWSSLTYISVISNDSEVDLKGGCIPELQKSLNLTAQDGDDILALFENQVFNYDEKEFFFSLRTLCFLSTKGVFVSDHSHQLYRIMEQIAPICRQSKHLDPVWKTLCKFWGFI